MSHPKISASSVSRCASPTLRPLEGVRDWLPDHHPSKPARDTDVRKRIAKDVHGADGVCRQDVMATMEENLDVCAAGIAV